MVRLPVLGCLTRAVFVVPVLGLCVQTLCLRGQEVKIPDPELRLVVRHALEKPEGAIFAEDMENLTELDASRQARFELRRAENRQFREIKPIRSLVGLESAVNLELLNLGGDPPEDSGIQIDAGPFLPEPSPRIGPNLLTGDLTALAPLTKLSELNLEGNVLVSVSIPDTLVQLKILNLRGNRNLRELHIPRTLSQLKGVSLRATLLQDYSFLSGRSGLESLDLAWNQLRSFALPKGLEGLRVLILDYNGLRSVEFLDSLPSLETLSVRSNGLRAVIRPDSTLNMVSLNLSGNEMSQFNFLEQFPELRTLDVSRNHLESFILPDSLRSLTDLNLSHNELVQLPDLENLQGLKFLRLVQNKLTRFELVTRFPELRLLDLTWNQLREFSIAIGALPKLEQLLLGRNQFDAFDTPSGMVSLERLDLSQNQILNIVLPSDLVELETLDLSFNRLKVLKLPMGLTTLQELKLLQNGILNLIAPVELEGRNLFGIYEQSVDYYATIRATRVAAGLELSWGGGALQRAREIGGAWEAVPEVTSPFIVPSGIDREFYRVNSER